VTEAHGGHVIEPSPGTACRTRDGKPADLLSPLDYPVLAVCAECGRAIRCRRYLFADWIHVDDES
jgi:hypothetical protein